jgi:hypothetical protein
LPPNVLIGVDHVVEIARVGVEHADLAANGLDDSRVRMPDRRDVVVEIEISATLDVEHVDAFGAFHPDRLLVEQDRSLAERSQSSFHRLPEFGAHRRRTALVEGVQRQNFSFLLHRKPPLTAPCASQSDRCSDRAAAIPRSAWRNVRIPTTSS